MFELLLTLLATSFALAIAIMVVFPKSDSGRSLHRMFVEPLSRATADLSPMRILALIILMGIAMGGPEMWVLMAALGIDAALVEVMIIVWAASVSAGFRNIGSMVKDQAAALVRRAAAVLPLRRAPRSRRIRKGRKPGRTGDSSGPAWDFAGDRAFA